MKKYLDIFLKAVLAGVAIGVGGTVYLSVENKIAGSFLFAIGLFVIFSFGFNLFTGKIGYLVGAKPSYLLDLIFIWLGNLCGTFAVGFSLGYTRVGEKLADAANKLCIIKLEDSLISVLVLAFFCGLLMFIAADTYKNAKAQIGQYLGIFIPVMVFILSGFEHCVANMYYFSLAGVWNLRALGYMAVMTFGNALGAFLIPVFTKLCEKVK